MEKTKMYFVFRKVVVKVMVDCKVTVLYEFHFMNLGLRQLN